MLYLSFLLQWDLVTGKQCYFLFPKAPEIKLPFEIRESNFDQVLQTVSSSVIGLVSSYSNIATSQYRNHQNKSNDVTVSFTRLCTRNTAIGNQSPSG